MKKTVTKPHTGTAAPTVHRRRTGKMGPKASPLRTSMSQAANGVTPRYQAQEAARPTGRRSQSTRPLRTTQGRLEQRVAVLEQELQQVKASLARSQPPSALPWWERLTGSFANDPLFDDMVAAGQAYRRVQNARSRT